MGEGYACQAGLVILLSLRTTTKIGVRGFVGNSRYTVISSMRHVKLVSPCGRTVRGGGVLMEAMT